MNVGLESPVQARAVPVPGCGVLGGCPASSGRRLRLCEVKTPPGCTWTSVASQARTSAGRRPTPQDQGPMRSRGRPGGLCWMRVKWSGPRGLGSEEKPRSPESYSWGSHIGGLSRDLQNHSERTMAPGRQEVTGSLYIQGRHKSAFQQHWPSSPLSPAQAVGGPCSPAFILKEAFS